ncbi:enoyl-CoA hydratase-related protein [Alloalcanivorax mobilis]|uniref:enoyl-CoA hydratase-related protein n=1 Tax=Alloalcanivorax mobilis TaxID=2019569 RepID=UPI000C76F470|nr:enoyl-CoA hydratase-related protein [Alloalcanivorax mobilis]|tara:strand:- start:17745 stop:18950 length:1206 start_codon:yes stop_codon:yes gene_type:complete
METSEMIEVAQALYAALAEGDRETLDRVLHPRFTAHMTEGMPADLGGEYTGAESTRRNFWGRLGRLFDARAQPETFHRLEAGGLLVRGEYQGLARASGRPLVAEFVHELQFSECRVAHLRQLTDSALWQQALSGPPRSETSEAVTFTVKDGLAELTLNRPASRNAIDLSMAEELQRVAIRCSGDPSIRALLISAAGEHFTVGGDLNFLAGFSEKRLSAVLYQMTAAYHQALNILSRLPVPVIAAVQGAAAGGGLGLLYVADIVYVADDLRVATGFGALGLSMDGGNSWYLPRLIGQRRAAELYFEGRVLNAEEAVEWGLATRNLPGRDLLPRAKALAVKLSTGPTLAFGEARGLLRGSYDRTLSDQLVRETEALSRCADSNDAMLGIQSFLQNKKFVFSGR